MTVIATKLPWHVPMIFAVTFVIHYLDRNAIAYALPRIAQEWDWSNREVGEWGKYLLGAFFLTYGVSQMALAGAAERFGAKRSMVVVIIGFSCVSMAVGPLGSSLAMLIALRLLLGLAESVHVPMMAVITARLFPSDVRATANSIWCVGLIIATALGPVIMVPLMVAYGWRGTFVIVGASGLLIALPLVLLFVHDQPGSGAHVPAATRSFRQNANYWLFVLAGVLNAFCANGVLNWLPTYFVRAKGIDFQALGWPLGVVFTAGVVGALAIARLGDRLQKRIPLASLGLLGAAAVLYFAISAQSLRVMVGLFALAVFCQAAFQAQEHATLQKIAQDTDIGAATGTYNGICLMIGAVVGSMVPGAIVSATGSFDLALLAIAVVAVAAASAMAILALRTRELDPGAKRSSRA